MSERQLRRALASLRVPGEEQAEARTWSVVAAGYAASRADAEPRPRRRLPLRAVAVVASVAAVTAAVLTAPGQAVLDSVREAIGVEHAQPALFSLPASGSLLVASPETGTWLVRPDGSKRRLGDYREASWSPFGRFVVAARTNELVALEPNGRVRWSLARPGLRFPRWGGSRTDTRIAYLAGPRLHVVAGDASGDADTGLPGVAAVPPAWQPARTGKPFMLAYADDRGRIHGYEPDGRRESFQTRPAPIPSKLEWSSDGRLLLAVSPHALRVYDVAGRAGRARRSIRRDARRRRNLPARRRRRGGPARPRRAERCLRVADRAAALPDYRSAHAGGRVPGRALAPRRLARRRPMVVHSHDRRAASHGERQRRRTVRRFPEGRRLVLRLVSALAPAGQRTGLLHPIRELSLVELLVLVDVEVAHVVVLRLAGRKRTQ